MSPLSGSVAGGTRITLSGTGATRDYFPFNTNEHVNKWTTIRL